jgi:DNA-binding NarL/FixJ family response regulator
MGFIMVIDNTKGIVLVVDDSTDALGILNESLVGEGYTVVVAMDGVQALAIANLMPPDIILMDAIMPNMDGFDTCKKLKESSELHEIPVIFMTGLSDSQDVIKGLEAGGVDYINKPVKLDELLARIKVHLNNSRMTQSARVALDEVGQLTFVCDIKGKVVWSTVKVRHLLTLNGSDDSWLTLHLPNQIKSWLTHNPEKNHAMQLKGLDKVLQVKFLRRLSPHEYLLKLLDDDELFIRAALKAHFKLTEREAEVLFWLSRGKTNREIALILSMSPRTVNKHLEPVFRKLAVENRTAAASVCLQYMSN